MTAGRLTLLPRLQRLRAHCSGWEAVAGRGLSPLESHLLTMPISPPYMVGTTELQVLPCLLISENMLL